LSFIRSKWNFPPRPLIGRGYFRLTLRAACCIYSYGLKKTHQKKGENMKKTELVEKIAADAGISKKEAKAAMESFMDNIVSALKKKKGAEARVTLVGFGSFRKVRRKKRQGRNPQTSEPMTIPARNAVVFKAGKKLIKDIQ
jgi:DNA-binding protein HU-beta